MPTTTLLLKKGTLIEGADIDILEMKASEKDETLAIKLNKDDPREIDLSHPATGKSDNFLSFVYGNANYLHPIPNPLAMHGLFEGAKLPTYLEALGGEHGLSLRPLETDMLGKFNNVVNNASLQTLRLAKAIKGQNTFIFGTASSSHDGRMCVVMIDNWQDPSLRQDLMSLMGFSTPFRQFKWWQAQYCVEGKYQPDIDVKAKLLTTLGSVMPIDRVYTQDGAPRYTSSAYKAELEDQEMKRSLKF